MTRDRLKKLERDHWAAVDRLRANTDLKASGYSTSVLGLIFLKLADNKYRQHEDGSIVIFWLRDETLEDSTGRRMLVQPVVLFLRWFVQATPGAHRAVWMMEPKGVPAFLTNEPMRLTPADVKLAAFHLSRYVRSCEKAR